MHGNPGAHQAGEDVAVGVAEDHLDVAALPLELDELAHDDRSLGPERHVRDAESPLPEGDPPSEQSISFIRSTIVSSVFRSTCGLGEGNIVLRPSSPLVTK